MAAKTSSNEVNPSGEIKICKECKIPFSDIYEYTEHLESKQHIKGVMKKKYAEKYLAAKAKLEGKSETSFEMLSAPQEKVEKPTKEMSNVAEKPVENSVTSSGKDNSNSDNDGEDEVYTCEVCKKICTGLISFNLHLQGKKHKTNLKKIEYLKQIKAQNMTSVLNVEPKEETLFDRLFPESRHLSPHMDCKVCKKTCLGPEAYNQHCKSESHKKKIILEELLKDMELKGLSPVKVQDEDTAPFAQCDICNKAFSGPAPYVQHMKSNIHLKNERTLRELGRIKDFIVTNDEDSKFKCKECNKVFSGPVPFNVHLKSSAHGKMKKKSDLMDSLEKKHPELIKAHTVENSNDSEEDDVIMLGCKVCQIGFSGPEAANDHFTSTKHKKAVKKKATFKKFKQQQKAGKLESKNSKKKSESDDSSEFEEEFDIIRES